MRLNILSQFYRRKLQTRKQVRRYIGKKKHVNISVYVFYLLIFLLAFFFFGAHLYADRIEARVHIEHFACDASGKIRCEEHR